MTERLRLVSHFPGRLRVASDTFRVLPDTADAVAQRLREETGVANVEPSRRTGSLLVLYDPAQIQLPQLIELLVRVGGLHGLEVDARGEPKDQQRPGVAVRALLDRWDRAVRASAEGKLDLRSAVPGALAALGVGVLLFGKRRVPEWYDLLFWSFVTFVNLNPPEGAATNAMDGGRAPRR